MMSLSADPRRCRPSARTNRNRLFPHSAVHAINFTQRGVFERRTKVIGLVGSEANPLPAAPEDGICVPPTDCSFPLRLRAVTAAGRVRGGWPVGF